MKKLSTLIGHEFQYKETPDGELIIFPADRDGNVQEKSAIVITTFTIGLVKDAIKSNKEIPMGASRDKPPRFSLGALIKKEKQSPQQLSYLIPILVDQRFCTFQKSGKAFVIKHLKE